MVWVNKIPSLYYLSLRSIDWRIFNVDLIIHLPGIIKEDLLKYALLRGKLQEKIGYFLHPKIRTLDIGDCKITNEELEHLYQCVDIRVLEMNPPKYSRACHLSSTLESLFSRFHRLVKLHVQRNDGVTDGVISVLVNHCPVLQELDVCGCTNLTNLAAKSMASLSFIKGLNLSETFIGDEGMAALGKGKSSCSLCELRLNNCIKVSDTGINALVQGCTQLSIFVFCGCPKVTVDCQLALDSLLNKSKRAKLVTWTVYF